MAAVSLMPPEAPSRDLDVLAGEPVSEVLRTVPLAFGVNVLNAGATCWVLSRVQPPWPGPACWLGAIWLVAAARLLLWRLDRRAALAPDPRGDLRARFARVGAGLGIGAAILLPEWPAYQLFVAFVVGGMCAGSVTTSAAHFPTLASFVLAATLPLAGRFLADGAGPDLVMGVMGLVFAAALLVTGRRFSQSFGERALLQSRLNEANRMLRAEIEEHRATGESLRKSQKLEAIGRLTAGIAHDFNNLLMSIGGNVELLRNRSDGPETARRLEAMRGAVERGSLLTRQLLAFGRRQQLTPQIVDPNVVLHDTVRLLGSMLGSRIKVVLQPGEQVWAVFVDPGQIEHAVLNLALNARDAMPDGGTVTIGTANRLTVPPEVAADLAPGDYVELSVADTGAGMAADVLARAVEPFYTTKEPGQGSGLGLSQVYGIARQSGGAMRIESEAGRRHDRPALPAAGRLIY